MLLKYSNYVHKCSCCCFFCFMCSMEDDFQDPFRDPPPVGDALEACGRHFGDLFRCLFCFVFEGSRGHGRKWDRLGDALGSPPLIAEPTAPPLFSGWA